MTKEHLYIGGAFLVGITYRLLMGLQGIDHGDLGFCMTFYQNIFTHPEAMTFYFNYYLTGLIGGLWQMAFGQYGLLGFRLLEAITLTAAIWLLYKAFRPWLPSPRVVAAAITLSFLFPSFVITFHYDTLSYLLMAASAFALSRWLQGYSAAWLTMAGMMIGLCFFARVINGALIGLLALPVFWGWSRSRRRALDNAVYFGGGILAGVLLMVLTMWLLGHLPYYVEGLAEEFGTLYGHNNASGYIIGSYLKGYVNIALQILILAMLALYFGDAGHMPPRLKTAVHTVTVAALFILVFTSQPYLSAVALCTLIIVITHEQLPLAFYALTCAYLFPFGSSASIASIFHWCGGLLIIPAACCYERFTSQWRRHVIGLLMLAIGLTMLYKMCVVTRGEDQPRTKTFTQALSGTLNTMTDTEQAMRYRNEVARICEVAGDNPLLLIANQASELYYATGKLPFTGNTQIGAFTGNKLTDRLDQQLAYYKRQPLIAFIRRGHDSDDMEAFRQTLRPWMTQQGYQSVYSDDDMELFMTTNQQ
ncbi:MAG: glycosyltransferase family 39 protein [Prevotella sp.]|nr:glycosyltransferase family 39 protein [Prevotella sp.]